MKALILKPINAALIVAASVFLVGCGGGGGGSSTVEKVSGSVQASVLKGVKVCLKDTGVCTTTDKNGKFTLDTTYPATLELSVAGVKLAEVEVKSYTNITPGLLSEGNVTLGGYLGAFLHKAAGCGITAYYCDLSNVKSLETNASGESLVEMVKNAVQNGVLYAKANGKDVNVTLSDIDEYVTANPIISGKGDITYQGVMTLGDYAEFNFDLKNSKVDYSIKGNVLGKLATDSKIYNMYNNMLFVNSDASNFYYLTASGMFSTVMNNGKLYSVIGIAKNYIPLTEADVSGKTFNILLKDANIANETVTSLAAVSLNPDHTFGFVTKDAQGNVIQIGGVWSFAKDKVYLKDSNGEDFMILAIKKGRHQSIAVADFINGGFGLATEAVPAGAEDFTGYRYLKFIESAADKKEICMGTLKVAKKDDTHVTVTEKDAKCFTVYINSKVNAVFFEEVPAGKEFSYEAVINPVVEINGNYVPMNSMALSSGAVEGVTIIDGDNGLFAQVGIRDSKEVAIFGSNKPIH